MRLIRRIARTPGDFYSWRNDPRVRYDSEPDPFSNTGNIITLATRDAWPPFDFCHGTTIPGPATRRSTRRIEDKTDHRCVLAPRLFSTFPPGQSIFFLPLSLFKYVQKMKKKKKGRKEVKRRNVYFPACNNSNRQKRDSNIVDRFNIKWSFYFRSATNLLIIRLRLKLN